MCCSGASWKREVVPDHKFDFIDVRDFHSTTCATRAKYMFFYALVFKSFLVYMSDIFTGVTMLTTTDWSNQIQQSCTKDSGNGCVVIPFVVAKWLFVGCIILSFLLLIYEANKAKRIIASRDISYAFTNVMANNYYSLRSYDHFCLFSSINNSTKKKDDFAFFVFFTFKGWKRLLFTDAPRQTINALTLYGFYLSKLHDGPVLDLQKYSNNFITSALIVSTLFTVLSCAISLILLIVAAICYVPLLCYIRGNLKEYCCHKVDKRITEIVKRKNKQRRMKQEELAKKEAMGDFRHLKNKKGEMIANPLPQPTLPNISLDDDDSPSIRTKVGYAPSTISYPDDHKSTQDYAYPDYLPAMPQYQPYSNVHPPDAPAPFAHSTATLPAEEMYDKYDAPSDYGSVANLNTGPNVPHLDYDRGYDASVSPGFYNPHDQHDAYAHDAYGGYNADNQAYGQQHAYHGGQHDHGYNGGQEYQQQHGQGANQYDHQYDYHGQR